MKTIAFIIFIFITSLNGVAQYEKIDSLKFLLQQDKIDSSKINNLNKIGSLYAEMKNDSALIFFNEAFQLSGKIGYDFGGIVSRRLTAIYLLKIKSDYASALDLYLKNLKTEEQTGDTSFIFLDTRDVSLIYADLDDTYKQLEYINKLRHLIKNGITKSSAKLSRYNSIINVQLSNFYRNPKQYQTDSVKYYSSKVYNYGLEENTPQTIALGSSGLADCYAHLKNIDSAIYYYRISIKASSDANRMDIYCGALIGIGNLYLAENFADSAYSYGIKALELSKKEKSNTLMLSSTDLISKIFKQKGQTDSAYKYLEQTIELKDSIFSSEKLNRIQSINIKETLQKQQEEQTKKEALQEFKSKIQIYSLIGGIAILSFIIFILYRNNRLKKAANVKIEKAYKDLKSTQAQLIQSEKMASLGELTAGIAHEIQNPMNFVNNFSEVNAELIAEMKDEISKGNFEAVKAIANDIEANEQKINHHGKRADSIVKGMLLHSRSSSGDKEPTDINALADEYLRLAYHGLRAKDKSFNAKMKTDFDESIRNINVVPQDIGRVILNLITNAFYAVEEKKKQHLESYEPTVTIVTKKSGDKAEIRVADNGNGIPQKVLDKIFQPFFTTKPAGQGTGLGLSLSYDIVKAHGGEIKVDSDENAGTEFTVSLPLTNVNNQKG